MGGSWRIWVDTGGTFTDCVAIEPDGKVHRVKVLSSGRLRGRVEGVEGSRLRVSAAWSGGGDLLAGAALLRPEDEGRGRVRIAGSGEGWLEVEAEPALGFADGDVFEVDAELEAPVLAAHLATGTPVGASLPRAEVRLATTRGTNALLESRVAPTAVFLTEGFGDLLAIGDQRRPDIFALDIERPGALHRCVVEVPERLDAEGGVLREVDLEVVRERAAEAVSGGAKVAGVALMHAWRNPAHERAVADVLREAGFEHVSCSSDVAPMIKVLHRAQTTVVDASLTPIIRSYLDRVREQASGASVRVMTSAGGLSASESFLAKDSLLSGPAGGVVGAIRAAQGAGEDRILSFDMGGTSTDVARCDGVVPYTFEHSVAGRRVFAPAVAIESVAAGGGSVCTHDEGMLRVGPESAGADPGPACYGRGGPLTVTDVNLLLGRLDGSAFEVPIDEGAARARLGALIDEVASHTGERPPEDDLLESLVALADEAMAEAIRKISVRMGYDPGSYALLAFGGAGGQHACGVASRLGIGRVIVPRDAGLLSAVGLGAASVERFVERQVLRELDSTEGTLDELFESMAEEATARLADEEGLEDSARVEHRRVVTLRLRGQESGIDVEPEDAASVAGLFAERYRALYGHEPGEGAVEVVSVRVSASVAPENVDLGEVAASDDGAGTRRRSMRVDGRWVESEVVERGALGGSVEARSGPLLVTEPHGTTLVPPGWRVRVTESGALVVSLDEAENGLARERAQGRDAAAGTRASRLSLMTNRLSGIAEEMGEMLQRMALSTNVKERLDFSCAIVSPEGELVVNAPHVPVHLGALGLCVRRSVAHCRPGPGETLLTNHPGFGGSHLPDLTLITPVHDGEGALLGYVVNRAHHAEVGGVRPGSMSPLASRLVEEGVVIAPTVVAREGRFEREGVRTLLSEAAHPSRAVAQNLADLEAQLSANSRGVSLLRSLGEALGTGELLDLMEHVLESGERQARRALGELGEQAREAVQRLDDGTVLSLRLSVDGEGRATFDFRGTGGVHEGPLNAPEAITRSAIVYAVRLLAERDLPLNEGLLRPVELVLPACVLNPPMDGAAKDLPAVAGGNVETSQRLVDTLLLAMRLGACSQGTMNNVIFGTDEFGYYETIGGGAGATARGPGASGVHTHMTNTGITDPEILEHRYPVRLERFAIRSGSGGGGAHRGGDGLVRELTFLEPVSLSLLTQHRESGPYGLDGGEEGLAGAQRLITPDGEIELGSVEARDVEAGWRLVVETPGGGGYGRLSG